MTALAIIAAWFAVSIIAGLLIGRAIPQTSDDHADQCGEGRKVRSFDQFHGSAE